MGFLGQKGKAGRNGGIYFHGGVSGLVPGDLIEPPTSNQRAMEYRTAVDRGKAMVGQSYVSDPGKVYMTTDLGYARVYADRHRGDVYEVVPLGQVDKDPDHLQNCFQSFGARVVKVVERQVDLPALEALKLRAPYMSFHLGIPLYDDEGFLNETPSLRVDGWTAGELKTAFGKWADPSEIYIASRRGGVDQGIYDSEGWLQPTVQMVGYGVTPADFREFGKWPNPRAAIPKVQEIIDQRRIRR